MKLQASPSFTARASILSLCAIFAAQGASGFSSKDLQKLGVYVVGGDDHNKFTSTALNSTVTQAPDFQQYSAQVLQGVSSEGGILAASGLPTPISVLDTGGHSFDGITQYWQGSETKWETIARTDYYQLNFPQAYKEFGYMLHMVQDAQVPAHNKIVFHGVAGSYLLSPNDSSAVSGDHFHEDDFERYVSFGHGDFPDQGQPWDVTATNAYGCPAKFWLKASETAPNTPGNASGAYGSQQQLTPCAVPYYKPTEALGLDWFGDGPTTTDLTVLVGAISKQQQFTARSLTISELTRVSNSLPPLILDLSVSAFITPSSPLNINFSIIDAYTPDVRYTGHVYQGATLMGDAFQNLPLALTHDSTDGLPYEGHIANFTWDGTLVGGKTLPDGVYTLDVRASDASGNSTPDDVNQDAVLRNDTVKSFTVASARPVLKITDGNGAILNNGDSTDNDWIFITAVPSANVNIATLSIFFQDGSFQSYPSPQISNFFAPNQWYWVQACDTAGNCSISSFSTYPPGTPPPPAPAPPAAPNGGNQGIQPPYPQNPVPCPNGGTPQGLLACLQPPTAPRPPWNPQPPGNPLERSVSGHDPNSMSGPQGSVSPGQLMTYTIEFENTGQGLAIGTYIKDVLDPALDETTLNLRSMYSVNFATGGQSSPAAFPWSFDSKSRSVTIITGDAAPSYGGSLILEARLRADTTPGAIINNQALVYFPNSLEITPTNTIISAVPQATQVASVGDSGGVYLSTSNLAMALTAGTQPVVKQPVSFQIFSTTATALTDSLGKASTSFFLTPAAGSYSLGLSYSGDGFYYLPSTTTVNFALTQRPTVLQAPNLNTTSIGPLKLILTFTDDAGRPLQRQAEEPKTVLLDSIDALGNSTRLASSLLSGTSVSFQFSLPQPYGPKWGLRAHFDGDSRYKAILSSGTLIFSDPTPPTITVVSPQPGKIYSPGDSVIVGFSVQDPYDPAPFEGGTLSLNGGSRFIAVSSNSVVAASSLTAGNWTLSIMGADWAGNVSESSVTFTVRSDVQPPRTYLNIGDPNFSSGTVYATSVTSFSLTAFDDAISTGDMSGMGVAQTYLTIDGASSVYAGTFTLVSEGTHTLSYYSIDFAGNVESTHTASIAIDLTAPNTQLQFSGSGIEIAGGVLGVSSSTVFTLLANDPLSANVASGVDATYLGIDVDPFLVAIGTYSAPFTLAGGTHSIYFFSEDNVLNQEIPNLSSVTVDALPPRTSLIIGAPRFGTSPVYVSSATSFHFQTIDDLAIAGDGQGLGSTQTFVSLDSAPFVAYSGTFTLAASATHILQFYSVDAVGNAEVVESTQVIVDSIPPLTTLQIDGLSASATSLTLISSDTLSFVAVDTGAGLSQTMYALDGSSPVVNGSTFTLAAGTHTLNFQSVDNVGNLEPMKTASLSVLSVDTIPPSIALTPPSQSTVTTATPVIAASYSDIGRGVDQASFRLMLDGVSVTTQSLVSQSSATFIPATALSQGTHTATAFISDLAGNSSSATTTFDIDSVLPVTMLAIGAPQFSSSTVFIASITPLGFSVSKPAVTSYAVDGGSFTVFVTTFSLIADGPHGIRYFSTDPDGNVEAVRSSAVTVDSTPPSTQLRVGGVVESASALVVISTDTLGFSATDAGSGVAQILYSLDGSTTPVVYRSTFSISVGTHSIAYHSTDLVGNVEATHNVTLSVRQEDLQPPRTTLLVGVPSNLAGSLTYISTMTPLSLSAVDDLSTAGDGIGLGVAHTFVSVDSAAYVTYSGLFTVAAQGPHLIQFYSVDVVGNNEVAHSSTVYVDALPPSLSLSPNSGSTVTISTPTVAASYADLSSGISTASVQLSLDGMSITTQAVVTASSAAFVPGYALTQGTHTVSASVANNVGLRSAATATFFLDSIPPVTTLLVDGLATTATSLVLVSTDSLGFTASDSGTGVAQTLYALDGSTAATVFSAAFSVSIGTHALVYHSVDRAGNAETAHLVALSARPYQITAPSLTLLPPTGSTITTLSPLIAAIYADTITGVNLSTLRFSLDGVSLTTQAVVTASSATFIPNSALAQGTHTVTASIANYAGNAAGSAASFFVDSLPPVTTLLVDGLSTGATGFVANSTDTFGFAAVDAGTGVLQTLFALDGGSQTVFLSPFTLAIGTHTLAFHSIDFAGNVEASKSAMITVAASTGASYTLTASFDPGTLNLKSQGNFVTATIGVFGSRAASAINSASLAVTAIDDVHISSSISALSHPPAQLISIGGTLQLQVDFDRQALASVLPVNELAKVTLSGRFNDGTAFSVSGFIRTIMPGTVKAGHDATIVNTGTGAGVYLPSGAVSQDTDISVLKVTAEPDTDKASRDTAAQNQQVQRMGSAYEYGPEGSRFATPVTLTLPYDASTLGSTDPNALRVAYWDAATGIWQQLASTVDPVRKQVSAQTPHFSVYQVVAPSNSTGLAGFTVAAADTTFGLKAAYVFPNPVRGTNAVTIRIQPGIADSVEVHIYDVTGRKIHSSSAFSGPTSVDDGNGLGPQLTYDHVWDVSGVGSGVYTYVITARKAGNSDIHKAGKIGVIK